MELLGKTVRKWIKEGKFGEVIKIVYRGKGVSLNQFYSQGHWGTRSALKKKYRKIFDELFIHSRNLRWVDKFSLVVFYNSRHDVDNVTGMEKVFVDALKKEVDKKTKEVVREGYVPEDDKRFYKGMSIFVDDSLPTNTFEFIIIEHKDDEG